MCVVVSKWSFAVKHFKPKSAIHLSPLAWKRWGQKAGSARTFPFLKLIHSASASPCTFPVKERCLELLQLSVRAASLFGRSAVAPS